MEKGIELFEKVCSACYLIAMKSAWVVVVGRCAQRRDISWLFNGDWRGSVERLECGGLAHLG